MTTPRYSLSVAFFSAAFASAILAQSPGLTLPPSGNNQRAEVIQYIGPVRIAIEYSSPAVHGPDGKDRKGQIWGKLVPFGEAPLGWVRDTPAPWRAGANENTVFTTSDEISIEGKTLPAGSYGLHMIPGKSDWTLIFSKDAASWGSFFYDASHDALRITVQPKPHSYREWLTYEFTSRRPSEATAELQWEEMSIPWTIKVSNVNDIYVSHLRRELTTVPGFNYQGYLAAAQFTLQENTNLDQGLKWAQAAIDLPYVGQENFDTLSTKSQILSKLGRDAEAAKVMQTALRVPGTSPLQIHVYGRQLLTDKKNAEALAVFQLNAERNGDAWPVHVGLARGYAAQGDTQKALEHARKALPQAPDSANRQALEAMIRSLSGEKTAN